MSGWWHDDRQWWHPDIGDRWRTPPMGPSFLRDLIVSVLGWLLIVLLCIGLAYLLTREDDDGESLYYGEGGADHAVQVVSGSATEADRWQVGG